MAGIYIRELGGDGPVKAAIFDFDGTISTLRCGWEAVMERIMERHLAGGNLSGEELTGRVRSYIEESTGIQTIYQMEWLAEEVKSLRSEEPLNPWAYKDEYNEALLEMVNERLARLSSKEARAEEFLVPGSVEFLGLLKARGVEIHIASGTDDADVKKEAELLGITPLVSTVCGAPYRKKDCSKEAVIRGLLSQNRLTGRELMVVGDGKVEILLGARANAVTLGVASKEQSLDGAFSLIKLQKLKEAGADYIVPDFRGLCGD